MFLTFNERQIWKRHASYNRCTQTWTLPADHKMGLDVSKSTTEDQKPIFHSQNFFHEILNQQICSLEYLSLEIH